MRGEKEGEIDQRREKYQTYCSGDSFLWEADGGMMYLQLHANNKIFISRHLYSLPECAGVDYMDHGAN